MFSKGTQAAPVLLQPQNGGDPVAAQCPRRICGLLCAGPPKLQEGFKDYSDWTTIWQVYLSGEFLGHRDVLLQIYQNKDLLEELKKLGICFAPINEKKENEDLK